MVQCPRMNLYKKIFTKLKEADIQYLIVGGVAVNLYGYSRFTGDIDIILALNKENLARLDNLMHETGYTERLPITIKELANQEQLKHFIKEKNLKAFTYISGDQPQLDIDVIVNESIDFEKYVKNQTFVEIWGIKLPVVSMDDLIKMKKSAGRDKDLLDIEALLNLKNL